MADADARLLEHDRVKTATFRFRSRVQDTDVLKTSGPGLCEMPQEAVLAILSNVVQLSPTSREELDTLSAFFSVNRFFAWHFLSTADSTKVGVVQRFMVQAMLHRYSNDLVYSVRLFSNQPKTRRTNASSRGRKPVTYSSFPSSSSSSSLPSSSSSSSSSSAAAVSAINDETDAFLGAVDAGTYQDARCRAEDELQLLAPGLFKKVQPAGEVVASGKSSINMDCRSVFFATLRWLEKLNGVHRKPSPTLCWGVASPQDAAGGGGAGGTSFSYSKSYLVCHTSLNELAAAAASICRATDTAGSEFNDGLLTLRVIVVGPKGTGAVSGAGAGDGGGGAAAVPGVDVWPFDQWVRYRSRTSAAPVLALAIHSSAALLFAASDLAPSTCAQNVLLGITPALAQVSDLMPQYLHNKSLLVTACRCYSFTCLCCDYGGGGGGFVAMAPECVGEEVRAGSFVDQEPLFTSWILRLVSQLLRHVISGTNRQYSECGKLLWLC